jgi:hypothetical protein
VDATADDGAALGDGAQRSKDQLTGRGEEDRGVKLLRRWSESIARPLGPQLAGNLLCLHVAGARKGEDPPALGAGRLSDDVGGAEAVQAQALRFAGHDQGAIADQPSAQQRCGL